MQEIESNYETHRLMTWFLVLMISVLASCDTKELQEDQGLDSSEAIVKYFEEMQYSELLEFVTAREILTNTDLSDNVISQEYNPNKLAIIGNSIIVELPELRRWLADDYIIEGEESPEVVTAIETFSGSLPAETDQDSSSISGAVSGMVTAGALDPFWNMLPGAEPNENIVETITDDRSEAGIVLIALGTNDAFSKSVSALDFYNNLHFIATTVSSSGRVAVLMTFPFNHQGDQDGFYGEQEFSKYAHRLALFSALIIQVADQNELPLINAHNVGAGQIGPDALSEDGVHWDSAGNGTRNASVAIITSLAQIHEENTD